MKRGKEKMYNYLENVTSDVIDAIRENYTSEEIAEKLYEDRDGFSSQLNDDLWIDDSVTGNASGSYYCNSWKAEEAISHNWDLLKEAFDEFGGNYDVLEQGPEACDVTIRCYLLYQAIDAALDELEEDDEIQAIMEQLEEAESLKDAEERKIA